MMLIDVIRQLLPHAYWSAGFLACLLVVVLLSAVLFCFTRWAAWAITMLAAAAYALPLLLKF